MAETEFVQQTQYNTNVLYCACCTKVYKGCVIVLVLKLVTICTIISKLPFSHLTPSYPGGHRHKNLAILSIHVPSF